MALLHPLLDAIPRWTPVAVIVVSVLVALVGRRSSPATRRVTWGVGLIGLVLASGLWAAQAWVETPRQRVDRLTRAMILATQDPLDAATLDRLIPSETPITGPNGRVWLTYRQARGTLERITRNATIQEQTLRRVTVLPGEGPGRWLAIVDLRTQLGGGAYASGVPTAWSIEWDLSPGAGDGPRVDEITWLELFGREPTAGDW